ncbi:MAG: peptidoglycan DD-metalloendopeptidase family protein [Wenzhouxiangellaceae bacterium]|nr:peptidoglycan DD-metalloendopeptidase family protein [Wenzhouxiangellaceae bacterium]
MPNSRPMASRKSSKADAFRERRDHVLARLQPWLADARVRLGLGVATVLTLVAVLLPESDPNPVNIESETVAARAPAPSEAPSDTAEIRAEGSAEIALETSPEPAAAEAIDAIPAADTPDWQIVQVRRGDTLELIFRRLGLSPRLLHEIVTLDEHCEGLARLRPGDELAFALADDAFRMLRAELDEQRWLFVEHGEQGLASRIEPRALDTRLVEVSAEIDSSLFNAGKAVGLSDNMILRLAGIFGWDIDFALDIRAGDRFALVYEEVWRDGEFLRQGDILAARFVNQGRSFEAMRFDAGNGADFYDPEGRPMRKAFLRAPINFTRVSSNFNPARLHPVTRRVRPHNGTDYAAPTGTPVWSAGDGTVIEAGYGPANGNYIFIQHGNHIVTRYLHLSKKHVKRGDRVRQGQTIGLVGATGLASGPHLHYEFLVHGRHRNPRTVDLPEATPLPADLLPSFQRETAPLLAQLERLLPPDMMLAQAEPTPSGQADAASTGTGPAGQAANLSSPQ